jgi:general stress protein CsbA
MLLKIVLAIFLPGLLVILFTRVTYNHYIGTLLALTLLGASVYRGYTDTVLIGIIDVFSLVAGFLYSKRMVTRVAK